MRTVLLIDSLGAGGAQRQLAGLACMLKERGVDVMICTYYPIMFYGKQIEEHGVPCEMITDGGSMWKRFSLLRKKLLALQPDVVVAYLDTPCILASLIRLSGVKFKLIVSERNTTQKLSKRERLKFWLYRKADCIVPNSYAQGEFVCKHYPRYSEKTVVIPNFVDLQKFAFQGMRRRSNRPVILVAASVWPSKNTKGFIEAVRLLKQRRSDFVVKWFGVNMSTTIQQNKVYMDDCLQLIKEYGLEETCFLYPKTQQIDEEYRKADYFCLPSFYEGTPNVLCEAMACSLPIVCSSVCDNPKYVHEGENGFLFNPRDIHDMADKLEMALNLEEEEYGTYSVQSRSIAEQYMSEQMFVERYMALF